MNREMSEINDNVEEARRKLEEILEKAEKTGCLGSLEKLPSMKLLVAVSRDKATSRISLRLVTCLSVLLIAFLYCSDILTHKGFSKLWLEWHYGSTGEQQCTIAMPDSLASTFRPPVACAMCQGLTGVDRVSGITPEQFEDRYAYSGRPVVVTDGMVTWTAQHVFSFDFFKKIYTHRMEMWSTFNCQFFPYQTEFQNLSQVFNMSDERVRMIKGTTPWYIGWSNCDNEINNILRRHYEKPYFLPSTAETKKLDWIFMGTTGYGAPMHVDNVEHPSWQAQLQGIKKWVLQPPPECHYSCQSLEVVVQPGEIIVLDTNRWYHSTLIVSEKMSITIGAEYD